MDNRTAPPSGPSGVMISWSHVTHIYFCVPPTALFIILPLSLSNWSVRLREFRDVWARVVVRIIITSRFVAL